MNPSTRDKLFSILALAAMAAHAVAGPHMPWAVPWVSTGLSIALALGARHTSAPTRSLAAMLACLAVAMLLPIPWQAAMLLALVGFIALGRAFAPLRPPPTWRARGRVPVRWTLLVGGVTPVALSAWMLLFRPNLHAVVGAFVPNVPFPLLIAGAIGFAIVNAGLEELLWRGVLQDRLEPVFGSAGAISFQALSFGVQHAHGVPRGVAGVVLAGTWAVMLGMLRKQAHGIVAPFLAHVVADATIAVIVIGFVR